jgi:hypothetical protein
MTLPTDYAERKKFQMWTYLTEYFPDSLEAEVQVAVVGNEQHNKGEPMHWARSKSADQMNTAFRHMWDHKTVGPKDTDGCYHLAKAIWRLKAELQLTIEREREDAADYAQYGMYNAESAAQEEYERQLDYDYADHTNVY